MEQHPIPRNISGFQFHLVGDMTLKQFGYVAGGIVLAYFLYKLPLPQLITFPLAGLSVLVGAAFAFVPIQERPLDRWVVAFIKSIYSPTQFLWRKNNLPLSLLTHSFSLSHAIAPTQRVDHQIANDRLQAYLSTIPPSLDAKISMNEKAYINKTLSLFNGSYTPKQTPAQMPQPQIIPIRPQTTSQVQSNKGEKLSFPQGTPLPRKVTAGIEKEEEIKAQPNTEQEGVTQEKEQNLLKENQVLKKEASQQTQTNAKFLDLEAKLNELLSEKERLTDELSRLKQQSQDRSQVVKLTEVKSEVVPLTVKKLNAQTIKDTTGMPSLPTVPNIVLGVIRDNVEHLLPGIIVTVKDLSGMPVRAIKTNKLGQFAAATPLQNGVYLIEVEDPQKRYTFDIVEITLNGQVFMPIELTAKGQREIMRDKLTKELFGQPSM